MGPFFGLELNGDLYKVTEDSILFETLSTLVEIKKEDILAHKVLEVVALPRSPPVGRSAGSGSCPQCGRI